MYTGGCLRCTSLTNPPFFTKLKPNVDTIIQILTGENSILKGKLQCGKKQGMVMLWGQMKYAWKPGTRLWSVQSPPHESASQCKGSWLFGQGAADFAQKKASAVPTMLLVNCRERRKHSSLHFIFAVSLPFMRLNLCHTPNICAVVHVTSFVSGNFHFSTSHLACIIYNNTGIFFI